MRLKTVVQAGIAFSGATINAERLVISPPYKYEYGDYEHLDTLIQRVEGSNATATAKELYQFAILSSGKSLLQDTTLKLSLSELTNTMEESLVALAISTKRQDDYILDVIKEYHDFTCLSSRLQSSMKKYETRLFSPVNWAFLKPCGLLLQRYISYLDRNLQYRRAAFLMDGVQQIGHFSHILKRAKILLMAAQAVLTSVEELGIAKVLRRNKLQYVKAFLPYENGVQIGEQLAKRITANEYSGLELAFGAAYCLLSIMGTCIIVPIMCTTPAFMFGQCMWMIFSFAGLHLIVIAAYISFLEQ